MEKHIGGKKKVLWKTAVLAVYSISLWGLIAITLPKTSEAKELYEANIVKQPFILCQLTGNHKETEYPLCNNTSGYGRWVYGTDLGSMFTSNDKIYVVFGDTVGADNTSGGRTRHRPHVIATVNDFDHNYAQDTGSLTFRRYGWYGTYAGQQGLVQLDDGEITALPTSGWSHGTNNYLWLVHVNQWGFYPTSSHSVVWKFDSSFGSAQMTNFDFPSYSKFALGTMVQAKTGGQDYLYVYGTHMYRKGPVYLSRTRVEDWENGNPEQDTWVFSSLDPNSPSWARYDDNEVDEDAINAMPVVFDGDYGIGELSVIQNPDNKYYIMLYYEVIFTPSVFVAQIMLRTAPNPWGPWSAPQMVADCSSTFCYGSYMHPSLLINNGNGIYSLYFISSAMIHPGTSALWDCQTHPNSRPYCNDVYNTFLVRMDLKW